MYYSVKDICELYSLKKATVYKWIQEEKFPYIKLNGKLVRIKKEDFEKFINGGD